MELQDALMSLINSITNADESKRKAKLDKLVRISIGSVRAPVSANGIELSRKRRARLPKFPNQN